MSVQINETLQSKPLIEKVGNLPSGVLCRVTYPICNFDVLNHNNRIYPRAVFEKVISDQDVNEKLSRRTLFGEAEHPVTETSTRLDRSISHIVQKVWIDESTKQAFASLDVLNTPHGQLINTLLLAECQVGVSTRAEGELEETVDESTGNRYFRVIPEAYQFKTIDFTADPSTLNALPVKVEHNIVRQIKSGVGEGKIDKVMAVAILENFRTKAAVQLCESLKSESGDMNKEKDVKEGKIPDAKDQDTQVVNSLVEKAVKEDIKDEIVPSVETTPPVEVDPMVAPVVEPAPMLDPVLNPPLPASPVADQVADVAGKAKEALDKAVEIVAKAEELVQKEEAANVPPVGMGAIPLAPESYMGDPAGQVSPVIPEEEELLLGENKKLKEKLAAIREELIKESKSVDELAKKNSELTETIKKVDVKVKVSERVVAEALKKISRLEKVNESLKKDNENLKKVNEGLEKEKRTIAESINRETVKRYVKRLTEGSGYSVPANTLTLLESCSTEEEAERLFEGVKESLNEAALHSNGVSEIRVPLTETANPEQMKIQKSVSSAFSRM
jgi:hypothetical protein